MFIRIPTTTRDGAKETQTVGIAFIARVKTVNGQTVISQHGMDYDVWTDVSKDTVDDMIAEAGAKIVER